MEFKSEHHSFSYFCVLVCFRFIFCSSIFWSGIKLVAFLPIEEFHGLLWYLSWHKVILWALFQYPIRCLIIKSHSLKAMSFVKFYHFRIAPLLWNLTGTLAAVLPTFLSYCKSGGFEAWRGFTIRPLIGYRNGALFTEIFEGKWYLQWVV